MEVNNMEDYTLTETYTLPSKGLIYKEKINPQITLRSMTTTEEMKRLSHTDTPYKTIAGIIDDCIVEGGGISSYDMCLGDYQFLLHKLRVVTYGKSYKMTVTCPRCGTIDDKEIDLDSLKVSYCPEDVSKYFEITLPISKKIIKLKYQTPRSLDAISKRQRDIQDRNNNAGDRSYLFLLESIIDTIDGGRPDEIMLEHFIRNLPMRDTNVIIKTVDKINNLIGINTSLENVCSRCGEPFVTTFPITSEFFGPSID